MANSTGDMLLELANDSLTKVLNATNSQPSNTTSTAALGGYVVAGVSVATILYCCWSARQQDSYVRKCWRLIFGVCAKKDDANQAKTDAEKPPSRVPSLRETLAKHTGPKPGAEKETSLNSITVVKPAKTPPQKTVTRKGTTPRKHSTDSTQSGSKSKSSHTLMTASDSKESIASSPNSSDGHQRTNSSQSSDQQLNNQPPRKQITVKGKVIPIPVLSPVSHTPRKTRAQTLDRKSSDGNEQTDVAKKPLELFERQPTPKNIDLNDDVIIAQARPSPHIYNRAASAVELRKTPRTPKQSSTSDIAASSIQTTAKPLPQERRKSLPITVRRSSLTVSAPIADPAPSRVPASATSSTRALPQPDENDHPPMQTMRGKSLKHIALAPLPRRQQTSGRALADRTTAIVNAGGKPQLSIQATTPTATRAASERVRLKGNR